MYMKSDGFLEFFRDLGPQTVENYICENEV